jgi:hypothetical protein
MNKNVKKILYAASVGAVALIVGLFGTALTQAHSVHSTPTMIDENIVLGGSVNVAKSVPTPAIPPNPEICFLADTTGSMGPAIANVQANAVSIMNTVLASQPSAEFCAAQYRDIGDTPLFSVDQALTTSTGNVATAINGWSAFGGGDTPEAQINALFQLGSSAAGYNGPNRILVWFGDSNGHDPSNGHSLASAIATLQGAGITVIAVPVVSGFGNGLDNGGQATAVANATGGQVLPGATPAQLSASILAGLQNLPVTVTPVAIGCSPLNVSFAPASQTVTSGSNANFTETVAVPNNPAHLGTSTHCTVEFRSGGVAIAHQDIWVDVPVEIDLAPDTDSNELGIAGQTHTVTATLTSGGVAVSGATIDFGVTAGPNVGENGSNTTNASGETTFTYAAIQGLIGLGTDSIQGCVSGTSFCDTVTKDWVDTTPPVLTMPPDATNEATGPGGATHTYVATAADAVDPSPSVVCVPASGSLFPLGDTVITCTATDASGNVSEGTFTKTVEDTTPPAAACIDGNNPAGNEPQANQTNEDGFFIATAMDIVDLNPQVFIRDTGSGHIFGPYISGVNFKYVQAPGAPVKEKDGSGEVDWKLTGNGDPAVFAVDFSGNQSADELCFVPPPPK